MNIAIVVHTNTGHTLQFAQAVRDKLVAGGHEVDILGLRTIGNATPAFVPGGGRLKIKSPPDISGYDAVLVGGPVWAFKASPVVMKYLSEDVRNLKGKKALSFVTMLFAGGSRAIKMMNSELEFVGADVLEGEKFHWGLKPDAAQMSAAVDRICEKINS